MARFGLEDRWAYRFPWQDQWFGLSDARRGEVVERVRSVCASGQQAYWVCPLIEESEVLDYQAAEASYRMLTEALPELPEDDDTPEDWEFAEALFRLL